MASPEADIKRCKFVINVSYILGKDKIKKEGSPFVFLMLLLSTIGSIN
jgi:hypothetical protein